MGTNHFILILAAEALIVCFFVTGLLLLKNRRLRNLIAQLQARLKARKNDPPPARPPIPQPAVSYSERLDEQLALTKEHHYSLGSRQDIALDLDPDAPWGRRAAALRHALLVAEREATADEQINWDFLASRYQQLLSFNEDYALEPSARLQEKLDQAEDELLLARKRVANLERFKTLYFQLEERWERCKDKAEGHYSELKSMADRTEQPEDFNRLLEQYHSSYADIGEIIGEGVEEGGSTAPPDSQLHELRRLRSMTADQHRIISELQIKLNATTATVDKAVVIESLQTELTKQARYLQESETCIQLMEDELATANRKLEQLTTKNNQAAQLMDQVNDLKEARDSQEQVVSSLQQENRRLAKKLKMTQEAPPEDNEEARTLRKEVNMLQNKYNDLEEKYLNLKLKE